VKVNIIKKKFQKERGTFFFPREREKVIKREMTSRRGRGLIGEGKVERVRILTSYKGRPRVRLKFARYCSCQAKKRKENTTKWGIFFFPKGSKSLEGKARNRTIQISYYFK